MLFIRSLSTMRNRTPAPALCERSWKRQHTQSGGKEGGTSKISLTPHNLSRLGVCKELMFPRKSRVRPREKGDLLSYPHSPKNQSESIVVSKWNDGDKGIEKKERFPINCTLLMTDHTEANIHNRNKHL